MSYIDVMNVVQFVANAVRRPSIFRAGTCILYVPSRHLLVPVVCMRTGSRGPSLLADPEREPFQYEIQQQALHHLMPGVQSTTEEKIQGHAQQKV